MLVANPDVVRPDGNASPMPGRSANLPLDFGLRFFSLRSLEKPAFYFFVFEAGSTLSGAWWVVSLFTLHAHVMRHGYYWQC